MGAKSKLIKDLIITSVAWIIASFIMAQQPACDTTAAIICGFLCAGFPFGWKWLGSFMMIPSFIGIIIKVVGSVALGWIALPIVIVSDIIAVVNEK